MRILIKNGAVINIDGQAKRGLLTESGIICQLGNNISSQLPYEEIDATGCYVFPGGVNAHTHFNTDVGIARSCDDLFANTRAAACGDAATIIDHMGFGPSGCRLHHRLEAYRGCATHEAVIDYSFHDVIQHINHTILDEIPMVVKEGLSSSKFYLIYQYKLSDDEVLQALRRLHESGTLATVHPENGAVIAGKWVEFIAAELTVPRYHALSRPLECETEATARMINLVQTAGSALLYVVHLLNGLGLDYLRLARANYQPVWVETCPQYLLLDERGYDTEDSMKFIPSPPLCNVRERDKLWCGINDGAIGVVTTGRCTFSMTQRLQIFKGDFSRCPDGLPGMEDRTQLLFSGGVMTGRITPERFVKLTNAMPARLFGLWPQRGLLAPGPDDDVMIIDPRQNQQIQHRHLHDNTDYSSWGGSTYQDVIVRTLSRDGTIFYDSTFTGKAGRGRLLRRESFVPPVL